MSFKFKSNVFKNVFCTLIEYKFYIVSKKEDFTQVESDNFYRLVVAQNV